MQAAKACQARKGFLYPSLNLTWVLALSLTVFLNVYHSHTAYGQTGTIIEIDDIQPRMASPEIVLPKEGVTTTYATHIQKPVITTRSKWYESIWEVLSKWWRISKGG